MASKGAAIALIVLFSGCTSSEHVSMDGTWLLEAKAESDAGQCESTGTILVTGRTGEAWWGVGRRYLTGQIVDVDVTRTDSVLVSAYGVEPLPAAGSRSDVYAITRPVEASVVAGVWSCSARVANQTVSATGYWVMRRISSDPVNGIF